MCSPDRRWLNIDWREAARTKQDHRSLALR
jgi:hypothetical protein